MEIGNKDTDEYRRYRKCMSAIGGCLRGPPGLDYYSMSENPCLAPLNKCIWFWEAMTTHNVSIFMVKWQASGQSKIGPKSPGVILKRVCGYTVRIEHSVRLLLLEKDACTLALIQDACHSIWKEVSVSNFPTCPVGAIFWGMLSDGLLKTTSST